MHERADRYFSLQDTREYRFCIAWRIYILRRTEGQLLLRCCELGSGWEGHKRYLPFNLQPGKHLYTRTVHHLPVQRCWTIKIKYSDHLLRAEDQSHGRTDFLFSFFLFFLIFFSFLRLFSLLCFDSFPVLFCYDSFLLSKYVYLLYFHFKLYLKTHLLLYLNMFIYSAAFMNAHNISL